MSECSDHVLAPIDLGRIGVFDGLFRGGADGAGRSTIGRLESSGASAVWVPNADPDLGAAASLLVAGSRTLIVGTAVVSLWSTQPDALAANAHLVAESAPGRLALGVGVSHQALVEAAGVTFDQPQRRLERFMDELNSVLDRSLLAATLVGATGPKALAASCRQESGAVPYLVTVEHTRRARSIMSAESLLAPVVKVVAETDPLIARSIARRRLAFYWTLPNYVSSMRRVGFEDSDFVDGGSDRLVDAVCAWGDLDQIAERLHEHQAAGADHVSIHLLRTDADDPTDRWCSVIEAFHSGATALS